MKNVKYSIIVPVYNVENYLSQCIESVLKQKFNSYEIILINDGSTDNSGNLCNEFQKKDDRIKVFHKENGGLSSARNYGLENAIGEYTIFLDSDDFWMDNEFLLNISKEIDEYDLLIFNSYKYYNEGTKINPRFNLDKCFFDLSDEKKLEYIIKNNIFKACAWDKVIKTSILKEYNIEFPLKMLSEDMKWCGQVLAHVLKVNVYSNVVYAYRQRKESISKSVNEKHLLDIYEQIYQEIQDTNPLVLHYFAYEFLILYAYTFLLNNKDLKKKIKKLTWLLSFNISKKVKMAYIVFRILGFNLCGKFLKTYIKNK